MSADRVAYLVDCYDCSHRIVLSEDEFLRRTGPQLKAAIDSGNTAAQAIILLANPASATSDHGASGTNDVVVVAAAASAAAASASSLPPDGGSSSAGSRPNGLSSSSHPHPPAPLGAPTILCTGCHKCKIALTHFKRKSFEMKDPRSMSATGQILLAMQEAENEERQKFLMPPKSGMHPFEVASSHHSDHHREQNDETMETDPLMLALMKVRKDLPGHNHWHGETGTMRISKTLRWLVLPVMSIFRGLMMRVVEVEFVGSVTVMREQGAAKAAAKGRGGGGSNFAGSAMLSWWRSQWTKVLPLALAADAPVPLLVSLLIWTLFAGSFSVVHVFSSYEEDMAVVGHIFSGGFWATVAWFSKWVLLHVVTFIDGPILANFFMYATVIREPGYLLPSEERRREMKAFIESRGTSESQSELERQQKEQAAAQQSNSNNNNNNNNNNNTRKLDFTMISQALGVAAAAPMLAATSSIAENGDASSSPTATTATATTTTTTSNADAQHVDENDDHPFADKDGPTESGSSSYCKYCKISRPPRTYHCKVCNLCVLEHDHHCLFVCCIGKRNVALFYGFLITASSACFLNGATVFLFLISAGNTVSVPGWLLGIATMLASFLLTAWIGLLCTRQAHAFRTNKTAREMIQTILSLRQKPGGIKAEDMTMCWPGRPTVEEAAENKSMLMTRPIPPSNFAVPSEDMNPV